MRAAEVLAAPGSPADAWLRVWVQALVLAFLTNRSVPAVPAPLRPGGRNLGARLRECLLATVADQAVAVRARALRPSYDPAHLTASLARAAARALGEAPRRAPGRRAGPGPDWVIPQVRWLHEVDRLCPAGGGPARPGPVRTGARLRLPGLVDWPGARVGHRLRALRRHPLSMDLAGNRLAAWTALLGEDDQRAFGRDLATLGVGLPAASQLSHVAAPMGVTRLAARGAVLARPAGGAAEPSGGLIRGDAPDGNPG